jgi:uncharacterized membrane protein required for colicin V production
VQIDFYLFAAALILALWGLFTGAGRQALGLVLLLVAFALSKLAADALGHPVARLLDVRTYVGPAVTGAAVFLGAFVSARFFVFIAGWLYRRKQEHMPLGWASRVGGFLLGGLQVFLLGYGMLAWAAQAEYETTLVCRRWKIEPDDSISYRLAQRHNPSQLLGIGIDRVASSPRNHPEVAHPTGPASVLQRARLAKEQAEESQRQQVEAAEAASRE